MTARKRDYFDRAQSWSTDMQLVAARSRRTAWTVAGAAVAVALFEALALSMLSPLKTVQPITVLVDRHTGFVQALDPTKASTVTGDEALTRSYLAQYVAAREGFDRSTILIDYRKVAMWSAAGARSSYLATMPASDPASPLQRYPAGTTVIVHIKSVSHLRSNAALVRFDTFRRERDGREGTLDPFIAVVRYRYVDAPMAMGDRLVNPLGFQVTSYRRDAEDAPIELARRETPPSLPANAMLAPTEKSAVPPRIDEHQTPTDDSLWQRRPQISSRFVPSGSPLSPSGADPLAARAEVQ